MKFIPYCLLLSTILSFTLIKGQSGCGGVKLRIDNQYSYTDYCNPPPVFCKRASDTLWCSLSQFGGCYPINIISLTRNNIALNTPAKSYFKLICIPGNYKLHAETTIHSVQGYFEFSVYECPSVSINEPDQNFEAIKIYPNPIVDGQFQVLGNEQIKEVALLNLNGGLLERISVSTNIISIPNQNYTPGIYLIWVTTESGKKIIKKLIIE